MSTRHIQHILYLCPDTQYHLFIIPIVLVISYNAFIPSSNIVNILYLLNFSKTAM